MLVPNLALEAIEDGFILHVGDDMLDFEIVEDLALLQSSDPDAFNAILKLLSISIDRSLDRLSA